MSIRNTFSRLAPLILSEMEDKPIQAIILKKNVEQANTLSLEPGIFYKTLDNLERLGWIALSCPDDLPALHRYYLTDAGQKVRLRYHTMIFTHRERIRPRESGEYFKEGIMKFVVWLVRLYPRAWRRRYEEEMLAVLSEHNITLLTVVDLVFGVLDARMDPYYRTERVLSSLPRPRAAAMIFLVAFAIFLGFVQIGLVMVSQGFLTIFAGRSLIAEELAGTNIIPGLLTWNVAFAVVNLGLFAVTLFIIIALMWQVIALRSVKTRVFTIFCFVFLPVAVVSLLHLWSFAGIVGTLFACGQLEALMGVLFLSILKGKQAIAMRKKGLQCLVTVIDLLLMLVGGGVVKSVGSSLIDLQVSFMQLVGGLFPFAVVGLLLLFLVGREIHKRVWRFAFVPAALVILIMVATLFFFLVGCVNVWLQFGFIPSPLSMGLPLLDLLPELAGYGLPTAILVGVGLVLSIVLAFMAIRLAFIALRTAPTSAALVGQAQPAEEMYQYNGQRSSQNKG